MPNPVTFTNRLSFKALKFNLSIRRSFTFPPSNRALQISAAAQDPAPSQNVSDDTNTTIRRPLANFQPNLWDDSLLNYTPSDEVVQAQMEQHVKELKEEVKTELLANDGSQVIDINTIDALERLGVAHHFEQEIEEALKCMYEIYDNYKDKDDLHHTSLRFRILRNHGFYVSSGMPTSCSISLTPSHVAQQRPGDT
ncbi:hypothetical protein Ancab_026151 [Ancistrocladus abbreviatus]